MQKFQLSPSFKKSLLERIPDTIAVLIIDPNGDLIEKSISKSFESEFGYSELEYIAKLIGLRYKIAEFPKIMGCLEMTINIFKDRCIFVSQLSSTSFIAIITKNVDLEKTRNNLSKIKAALYAH